MPKSHDFKKASREAAASAEESARSAEQYYIVAREQKYITQAAVQKALAAFPPGLQRCGDKNEIADRVDKGAVPQKEASNMVSGCQGAIGEPRRPDCPPPCFSKASSRPSPYGLLRDGVEPPQH